MEQGVEMKEFIIGLLAGIGLCILLFFATRLWIIGNEVYKEGREIKLCGH